MPSNSARKEWKTENKNINEDDGYVPDDKIRAGESTCNVTQTKQKNIIYNLRQQLHEKTKELGHQQCTH